MNQAVIAGAFEAPYARHPPIERRTETLIVEAVVGALASAGLHRDDVDGFGVASFSLTPDHAIDMAYRMGMKLRWLQEDTNGGASGLNLLMHARRAIEAGDAEVIVLCSGDRVEKRELHFISDNYNRIARDYLAPLPLNGPNALFAFVTQRHARASGLEFRDYGAIPIAQRQWASKNPGAVYRQPMDWPEYLAAVPIAPPLTRYDCVPVVSGADAVVVCARDRVTSASPVVEVLALRASYNPDNQEGDGINTAFQEVGRQLFDEAGVRPEDIACAYVYDDYPVMALVQARDVGLVPDGDLKRFLHKQLLEDAWPMNTSGGQLSAGQAGAAGGMHGLVEAVIQLRGQAGERQVQAEVALVTGYGMVAYRHGACHNAAVLARS